MTSYVIALLVTALIGVINGAIMIAWGKRHAYRVAEKVRADMREQMGKSPYPLSLKTPEVIDHGAFPAQ